VYRTRLIPLLLSCRNAALALEKAEQQTHLNALKSRLEAFRSQGDTRLQKLSVGVRAAREKLDEQLSLASRILQVRESELELASTLLLRAAANTREPLGLANTASILPKRCTHA